MMVKCQLDEQLFRTSYRECNEGQVTHFITTRLMTLDDTMIES